ncbi:MAG TPA: hypothetical protein VM076_16260 [Gemmatimonadaceae bacterium]|nr:hypothetical protein [Gemmatimonadaceae bacterium]
MRRRLVRLRSAVVVVSLALAVASCAGGSTNPGRDTTTPPPTPVIPPGPYTPGKSYFGKNDYIEYVAGNAPVIYSAPHGGALVPGDIPDRTAARCGGAATTATDLNTADLVRAMQQRHFARYGTYPHIIINHLARRKLDANRTDPEAACGNAAAAKALVEWHAFIDAAKATVLASSGRGWYMDIHGHGHAKQRLDALGAQARHRASTLKNREGSQLHVDSMELTGSRFLTGYQPMP